MGHLGCKHRFSPPERPKQTIGRLLSVAPDIISCETDVLPAKRRDVRDNRRRDIDALRWGLIPLICKRVPMTEPISLSFV